MEKYCFKVSSGYSLGLKGQNKLGSDPSRIIITNAKNKQNHKRMKFQYENFKRNQNEVKTNSMIQVIPNLIEKENWVE